MGSLAGRSALVTGASSGIGAAIARALAAEGAQVVLSARRAEPLEALAAELDGAETLVLDVRVAASVESALAERAFDVVVPSAGLARGTEPAWRNTPDEWDQMIDTNVKGVLAVVRATLPAMLERGSGDLVLIGSVAGRQVYPGGAIYCATKYAVRALYESLRGDALGSGVRFSTVDPGMVQTDFSRVRFDGDAERAAKVYENIRPLQPEDVAECVRWIVGRPAHVNVGELVLWPTDQASTTRFHRP